MHLVSRILITRTIDSKDPSGNLTTYITFVTAGVIGSAVLGILLLTADLFISKKFLHDTRKGQNTRTIGSLRKYSGGLNMETIPF